MTKVVRLVSGVEKEKKVLAGNCPADRRKGRGRLLTRKPPSSPSFRVHTLVCIRVQETGVARTSERGADVVRGCRLAPPASRGDESDETAATACRRGGSFKSGPPGTVTLGGRRRERERATSFPAQQGLQGHCLWFCESLKRDAWQKRARKSKG